MLRYEFKRIIAHFGSVEIVLDRNLLLTSDRREFFEVNRRNLSRSQFELMLAKQENNYANIDEYLNDKDRSQEILVKYIGDSDDIKETSKKLLTIEKKIRQNFSDQILYLPTYRRIEQDLQSIFPQIDLDEIRYRSRHQKSHNIEKSSFIELVEFGMKDVEIMMKKRLEDIRDYVLSSLSNLTGTYLRDVIKGDYRTADLLSKLSTIDELSIEPILNRIPQVILTEQERVKLREIIHKIRTEGIVAEEDKVVAHFLAKLIDLYQTQLTRESDVREFIKVGNQYLSGKELVYDNASFKLSIQQKIKGNEVIQIELKMLSSGEKQIISLFSHIYLSGQKDFFVVIDEPELSLSVPWQKRFLPDILATNRCSGIIAVTHSPFIFDNEFDKYAHSIEEFLELI